MIKVILLLVGCYGLAFTALPTIAQLPFIADLPALWRIGGSAAAVVVALLLFVGRRGPGADLSDRVIKDELSRRGFHFITIERGWQAEGQWNKVPVVVRRQSDFQASRFGRPWVIVVSLPGKPNDPWPFVPEQAAISERRADGFSVVIVDCTYSGAQGRFSGRMDQLVGSRGL
jgi:hypothetical protein